jgi:hypothetical protein
MRQFSDRLIISVRYKVNVKKLYPLTLNIMTLSY